MKKINTVILAFLREIIFGLEDGLVSTLGAITGIAGATSNQPLVIISGFVVVAVESLSMAAGTYLSNKSETEANNAINHQKQKIGSQPIKDGIFMGISYIIGGSLAMVSYFILPLPQAMIGAVVTVVITLLIIGYLKGKLTQTKPVKSAIEMATVSLLAALLGYTIGKLAALAFPEYTNYL